MEPTAHQGVSACTFAAPVSRVRGPNQGRLLGVLLDRALQFHGDKALPRCSETILNALLKYQTSNYVNNSFIVECFTVFHLAK